MIRLGGRIFGVRVDVDVLCCGCVEDHIYQREGIYSDAGVEEYSALSHLGELPAILERRCVI